MKLFDQLHFLLEKVINVLFVLVVLLHLSQNFLLVVDLVPVFGVLFARHAGQICG